jgi:Spy/CpxP family protein refolding chaperone
MTTRFWKRLGTAAVLIGVLGVSTYAFAHDSWWMSRQSGPYVPGLTQEQTQKIDEIRLRYDEQILSLQRELMSKRTEVNAYASRPDADPDVLADLRNEHRALTREIEDLEVEAMGEARNLLTSEQQAYWCDDYDHWAMGCSRPRMHQTHSTARMWDRSYQPSSGHSMDRGCCW